MAKLIITLDGGIITETTLDTTQEYILGRGTQCQIVLAHAKVSRQHAKIFFDGQSWICKVISKFGRVEVNNHSVDEVTLNDGLRFMIPPFEMTFKEEAEALREASAEYSPNTQPTEEVNDEALGDHTRVATVSLKAVLRKLDSLGQMASEFTMEHTTVVAGRSSSCQIQIEDAHASRRHFSITQDGKKYVLKDLDSANKTYVNGQEVHEYVLKSGDEISVGEERHRFELVHPDFANLPAVVQRPPNPSLAPAPQNGAYPQIYQSPPPDYIPGQSPAVIKYVPQNQAKVFLGQFNSSKNVKVKSVALFALLALIVYGALSGNSKSQNARNVASGSGAMQGGNPFDRLPPEQKKFIEETYNLALNLYTTGKYDLAAIEVGKVLTVVANYKDAKNILALCQQAEEIKKQQDESDRVKRDQNVLQAKVTGILDGCDSLLKTKKYAKVEDCVAQVSEMDPGNERASNLVSSAKAAMDEMQSAKEEHAERVRLKAKTEKAFAQAQKDFKAKRYPAALVEFQQVERTASNDPDKLKEKARTGAAAVKEQMLKESQTLVQEGKTSYEAKEYGVAVSKFNRALELAPFNNEAKELREKAKNERHLEMKNVYSESVIEENLGNIESAKKKWASIIKEGDKTDSYFDKAQSKLRKYEK